MFTIMGIMLAIVLVIILTGVSLVLFFMMPWAGLLMILFMIDMSVIKFIFRKIRKH